MSELYKETIESVSALIKEGKAGVEDVVKSCVDRIEATEPKVQALLHFDPQAALDQARAMDQAGVDKDKPLWGVPVIIKDVLTTNGVTTTCGSKILENFVPFYDATAVTKLKEAGAVILAKANMDEFAMGSSTENSAYKTTRNPWNLDRVPGGSSGGSGSSVASCQGFAALGTDTGGSIRTPASFCGIVGMKPTYGRVSRYGMIAYGSSLDQIGPMARNVSDVARILQTISGYDAKDSTSMDKPVPDYMAAVASRGDLKGVRIGLPDEYWGDGLDSEVADKCREAVKKAEELGAEIVPVSLGLTDYAIATYYIIAMAEASSNLARFDGVRYGHRDKSAEELIDMYTRSRTQGFGDEVQRRIIIGTYVLSAGYYDAYYRKAAQVRRLIRKDFEAAYEKCDVIACPTSPTTAFPVGDKTADPLTMYLADIFTVSLNLSGLPGMSLPVGLGAESSMPVGLQLFGPHLGEETLLSVSKVLEDNMDKQPMPAGLDW